MKKKRLGLLPKVAIAIILGVVCGFFFPDWLVRIFLTINGLFGNFLGFIIPLLILGLVAPGIADVGKGAGRLLMFTALLAYGFTIFSGFFTYFTCDLTYPWLLDTAEQLASIGNGKRGDFDSLLYRGNAAVNGCDDLLASGFYFGFGNVCY